MGKKIFLILGLILGIIFAGGWLVREYSVFKAYNCSNFYKWFIKNECICLEGYKDLGGFTPYCATESLKPCSIHTDCPENERCISKDGKEWFCSGRRAGCYHWDPENPDDAACAD